MEGLIDWKEHQENVVDYLNKSKISILPSYREGFPKSLLEGASCGLPVIASDVPGCREICINGFNGFLVKPRQINSLQKSIIKLLADKKMQRQFSLNSIKLVKKNFDVNFISKKFVDLYQEVIHMSKKDQ